MSDATGDGSSRGGDLRVGWTADTDLSRLKNEWNGLVEAAHLSVFQTYEWITSWWRCFGPRNPLQALTVWDRGRLVGVFPLYVTGDPSPGLLPGKVLRFVGRPRGELPEIIAPGYEASATDALVRALSGFPDWDHVDLRAVRATSRVLPILIAAFQRHACWVHLVGEKRGGVIPLPAAWDDYLARLSPRVRREHARKVERVNAAGATFELAGVDLSMEAGIEEFIRLSRCRSEAKRWTSYEKPAARRFLREIVWTLERVAKTRLMFLRIGVERVACVLSFFSRWNRVAYGYEGGLNPGRWAPQSPGTIVKLEAIRDAIGAGMREYDLLEGDEPYKRMFKPENVTYQRYLVTAPRARARLRTTAWWNARRLVRAVRPR
jgi:CelD/BcsL family acetyltransferase involved in cellulose biosynthesis